MGHRMKDEPHVYGNDCLIGFPGGETPMYIWVRFSSIVVCDYWPPETYGTPPNGRVFKLTQDATYACLWEYAGAEWHVILDLQFDPPNANLWLEYVPDGWPYFLDTVDTPLDEGTVYNNHLDNCAGPTGAITGIATVTWTQEATNLLEALNMQRAYDLFMELHPLIDGNKVYKFCRLGDATNIAIEFEPD